MKYKFERRKKEESHAEYLTRLLYQLSKRLAFLMQAEINPEEIETLRLKIKYYNECKSKAGFVSYNTFITSWAGENWLARVREVQKN